MKKIVLAITKGNFGGAQRYLFDIATGLPKESFLVTVISGKGNTLYEKLAEKNIPVKVIGSLHRDVSFLSEIKSFIRLFSLLRKESPDILHLNSSKMGLMGGLCGRILGIKKIIFTAHGWPFKEDRLALVRLLIYIASWITVLLSHQTIVVSKDDEILGKQMWFVSKKINFVPIGLLAQDFFSREMAEKMLFAPEPSGDLHIINSVRLVTIAELTKNKGLEYGIDMMRELEREFPNKYTYTIFGIGEELSSLQKKAGGLLNSQRLPIVLFRSIETNLPIKNLSTEASRYLPAFDIFILPSIKEGMPYVLLEAVAAGLPIIATDAVENIGITIPNMHIVPSKSGKALARKVQEIAKREYSVASKNPHSYTFKDMLEKTILLYAS
jgi:glycosyltransferase involved in cell wall biosynthesis